jgi:hypothetical protein
MASKTTQTPGHQTQLHKKNQQSPNHQMAEPQATTHSKPNQIVDQINKAGIKWSSSILMSN